jgi:hypothetical protein
MMPSDNNLKAKITVTTILLIAALLCTMSCRECPTEPDYDIYLSPEDVFSTSVVLNVTLPDSGDVSAFALDRDDSTVATYTCYDDDTLIVDEDLTPNTDYIYRVRFLKDGKTKSESDPVSVHTMDTTSHDFTWEIDTLGNYGSYLKDAWIVDENNIWVVGNIETDSGTYNAAKWDGVKWNFMQVVNSDPVFSIQYFNENDIWVISYGYPAHFDGNDWTLYRFHQLGIDASALALWGTSSSNMYFVGLKGSIVHYDGSTFTKMETNTDTQLSDIDGTPDGTVIYAVGKTNIIPAKSIALEIISGVVNQFYYVDDLYQEGTYGYVGAVSIKDHYAFFSTPAGIWRYDFRNETSVIMDVDGVECGGLFVEDFNDIIGYRGGMGFIHYNGKDWRKERYLENHIFSYGGGRYKDGLAVMVGYATFEYQAVVARGHHQ